MVKKDTNYFKVIDLGKKLRNIFLLHLVIGSISLILLKNIDTDIFFIQKNYISLFFISIVMCSYYFFSNGFLKFIAPDIVGDSNYYLGFLFTLIALIITLIFGLNNIDDTNFKFSILIAEFGVAIITTLIGMLFRIVITQFNITSDEADEEARSKITHTVQTMSIQLQQAEEELSKIVINSQNRLNQMVEGSQSKLDQLVEGSVDIVKDFFLNQAKEFTDASKNNVIVINKLSKNLENQAESLSESLSKVATNLSSLTTLERSLSDINSIMNTDGFQKKFIEFKDNINLANLALEKTNKIFISNKNNLEKDVEFIYNQKKLIQETTEETRQSIEITQKNLTALSKYIIEKLN